MARKRIIDPEFWSDEEIGQWSFAARLFYIGLWNFADDAGRFKAHNDLLKAQIFPYEKKIDIDKLKKELNLKIEWYEVERLQYGFIRNFLKHQRIDKPTASKLPIPPPFVDDSPNTQGVLPPNISKDNRSKGERSFPFEELWINYPNKDGKRDAERHFLASVKTQEDWDNINKALGNYLASETVKKGYIKNGSTWFNNWRDWIDFKGVNAKETITHKSDKRVFGAK